MTIQNFSQKESLLWVRPQVLLSELVRMSRAQPPVSATSSPTVIDSSVCVSSTVLRASALLPNCSAIDSSTAGQQQVGPTPVYLSVVLCYCATVQLGIWTASLFTHCLSPPRGERGVEGKTRQVFLISSFLNFPHNEMNAKRKRQCLAGIIYLFSYYIKDHAQVTIINFSQIYYIFAFLVK